MTLNESKKRIIVGLAIITLFCISWVGVNYNYHFVTPVNGSSEPKEITLIPGECTSGFAGEDRIYYTGVVSHPIYKLVLYDAEYYKAASIDIHVHEGTIFKFGRNTYKVLHVNSDFITFKEIQ